MQKITDITGRLGNQMFQFAYIYSQMLDGNIPDIYVQDPAHFDRHREAIRKLYGTPIEILDYVALHCRRGDYVNNNFYVDLSKTDYYEKAMMEFPANTEFLVFSDEINWCMEHLKGDRLSFYENPDEIESFNAMSSCNAIIMANSSFSWWAAYLSNCGKVVAPSIANWYTDGVERTKCLPEWKRI